MATDRNSPRRARQPQPEGLEARVVLSSTSSVPIVIHDVVHPTDAIPPIPGVTAPVPTEDVPGDAQDVGDLATTFLADLPDESPTPGQLDDGNVLPPSPADEILAATSSPPIDEPAGPSYRAEDLRIAFREGARPWWAVPRAAPPVRPSVPTAPAATPEAAPSVPAAPVPAASTGTPAAAIPDTVSTPRAESEPTPTVPVPVLANSADRTPPRLVDSTVRRVGRNLRGLVLTFDEAMDAETASNPANFRVERISAADYRMSIAPGDVKALIYYARTPVALSGAAYDPTTRSVTLTPRDTLRQGALLAISTDPAHPIKD